MTKRFYTEWVRPVSDYYQISDRKELFFVLGVPGIVAVIVVVLCIALKSEIMVTLNVSAIVTVISIMMALSIMWIGLLSVGDSNLVQKLKEKDCSKPLHNIRINLHRKTLIQVVRLMLLQISTIAILLLFDLITNGIYCDWKGLAMLGVIVFLVLDNMLSIVVLVTELYFTIASVSKGS